MPPRPIKDRVLVRQDPKKDRLASGLYLAQSADQHSLWNNFATVLAVGEGRRLADGRIEPLGVKVGDRVLFKRTPGTALMPDARERSLYVEDWTDLLVLREDDIIGVVESEATDDAVVPENDTLYEDEVVAQLLERDGAGPNGTSEAGMLYADEKDTVSS